MAEPVGTESGKPSQPEEHSDPSTPDFQELWKSSRLAYERELGRRRRLQDNWFWPLARLILAIGFGVESVVAAGIRLKRPRFLDSVAPGAAWIPMNGRVLPIRGVYARSGFAEKPQIQVTVGRARHPCQTDFDRDPLENDPGTTRYRFSADIRIGRGLKYVRIQECGANPSHPLLLKSFFVWNRTGNTGTAVAEPVFLLPAEPNPSEIRFTSPQNPRVSVIVPVHNQLHHTLVCLDHLAACQDIEEAEVLLADDSSSPANLRKLERIEGLRILRNTDERGFLHNCNQAAKHARGEYLFFLNNDAVPRETAIIRLVETLDRDARAGAAGAKLLYPDGRLQEAGGIVWNDASAWNYGRGDDPYKPEYNYLKTVDYASAAALLVRREAFEEVGRFSTEYAPAYYEDTDLAFKLRKAGYSVLYQPRSRVVHFEGTSHGQHEAIGLKRYQALNRNRFRKKWSAQLASDHAANGNDVFRARDRSRTRPHAVFIDHYVPMPDKDAGSRSTLAYVKLFLSEGWAITFIGDNFFQHEPYTTNLQQLGVEVLYGPEYAASIHEWLHERNDAIDLVFANRSHIAAKYLDTLQAMPRTRFVYYGHDLGSLRLQRQASLQSSQAMAEAISVEETREQCIWQQADLVLYPSRIETEVVLQRCPGANARTLPLLIIEHRRNDYADSLEQRRDILFVGGFGHEPNGDAVRWFASEIWPRVSRELPSARFRVVGSNVPADIAALASDNLEVTGWVDDPTLQSLYRNARLSVVPLRFGAGIKGKVVESIHRGVPVGMTPIAAEGIQDVETCGFIARDAETFADELIALYRDDERLTQASHAATDRVIRQFSRDDALQALDGFIQKTANSRNGHLG